MLDYEWGNPSTMMLSGEEPDPPPGSDLSNHNFLHHYSSTAPTAFGDNLLAPTQHASNDPTTTNHFVHHFEPQSHSHHIQNSFYDPRVYTGASTYAPQHPSMLPLDPGFMMLPKSEENIGRPVDFTSRIGLNLGGRTYFSSEDDFMNRLYRRSRPLEPGTNNLPRCQAEGCNADLSHAKHYHRRHKVCEFHSKASTVIAAGLTQRFCQQCSRLDSNYQKHPHTFLLDALSHFPNLTPTTYCAHFYAVTVINNPYLSAGVKSLNIVCVCFFLISL